MTQSSSSSDTSSENNAMLLTSLGAVLAVALSGMGAATGSVAGAQYAVLSSAKHNGGNVLTSFVPIVIAGVLAIYGLIIAVILCSRLHAEDDHGVVMTAHQGQAHLAAGLAVGLSCLASGSAMSSLSYFLLWNGDESDTARNGIRNKQPVAPEREALLLDDKTSQDAAAVIRKVRPMTIKAVMMFCFIEALGLYGLIVALLLIGK